MTDAVDDGARPALTPELTAQEFERWYWLKDELADFSRTLGIRSMGGKDVLAARIAAALDGREFTEPPPVRRTTGRQLSGPLSAGTVIPAGQRCSQVVRAWLAQEAGASFHFDASMRAFFAEADGAKTMQDALDHWHATRDVGERSIGSQFEYNRFTKAWNRQHPESTREQLLAGWQEYRSLPIDKRGRA